MEALDSNPHQILKSKYFSSIQANWDDKATNMRRIAEELNLSTDSFVYFDDNPEECELIRQLLPEIKVVQVPDDPLKVEHVLDSVLELERFSFTQEDLARGEQYSANVQRTMLKESVSSLEEYYSSLHTKLTFHVNAEDQVERLSQLCQKTNQFNLTSKRYTDADVAAFMKSDESPIFSVEVEDRFGNSGLVGEAICKKISSDDWEIDTFLMSCRVLGRTIENAFLNFIVEQIASRKAKKIFATFVPTKKNGSVEDFYDKNGFKLLSSTNGTKKYELEYRDYEKQNLPWFTIVVK
jgi:FkbH-like protein